MNAEDRTTVSPGKLIVEHVDAVTGRRLVVIRGDIRVLGETEGHDHADDLVARVAELEQKLHLLTSS